MIPLSILDLAPVPEGSDPGQALRNTQDLARQVDQLVRAEVVLSRDEIKRMAHRRAAREQRLATLGAGRKGRKRRRGAKELKRMKAEAGKQAEKFLDPFHGGRLLTVRECVELLASSGESFRDELLEAVDDRVILCRMLGNLLNIYHGGSDSRRMNRVAAMLKLLQDPRD